MERGSGPHESTPREPLPFHLFADSTGQENVRREILEAFSVKGLKLHAEILKIAEVYARLRAAARSELRDSDALVKVSRDPDLWELRWDFRKVGLFRLYFAESQGDPRFVGLRFHEKEILASGKATFHAQNDQIDTASERHRRGVESRWGHTGKPCPHCVDP